MIEPGAKCIFSNPDYKGAFNTKGLVKGQQYTICYEGELEDVPVLFLTGIIGRGFDKPYFTVLNDGKKVRMRKELI